MVRETCLDFCGEMLYNYSDIRKVLKIKCYLLLDSDSIMNYCEKQYPDCLPATNLSGATTGGCDMPQEVKSGIYVILNHQSGKIYVGSAVHLFHRKNEHLSRLKKGIHHNKHLQNSWNKYGESVFSFYVLEFVDDLDLLIIREQFWMDLTQCYENGYNKRRKAESNRGIVFSEETRQKYREAQTGKKRAPFTKEHIQNMRKAQRHRSPEQRKNMREAQRRRISEMSFEQRNEMARRMRAGKKTHVISAETRRRMSESKRGAKNPMYGRKHSLETRMRISQSERRSKGKQKSDLQLTFL